MERINFTQSAMFHLASINTYLKRTLGSHYKISGDSDLEKLLKEAFTSEDPELKQRCTRLLDSLWTEEQEKLKQLLKA
ncbi:hypothetical protein [Marinobacter sp. CHS3-4]|uniref:hypothetical protein n=1 Tax=Marinobacter sp. CHS3-4 TaxID=3045174 RepID=UPI0024B5F31D|nr:hypothetical protein [Marinobacter sp. CHS3-4]MDI9246370.1 hypothetical protein [Marinobacter sp. CHS3-4]